MVSPGYVLVVEDDAAIRAIVVEVLEDEGFEVSAAADGLAALDVVAGGFPALVLLDLQMPRMDGPTFFHALRDSGCSTPVMILSAWGAHAAMRELGADDALAKPFDTDDLLHHVAALTAGRSR